MIRLRRLSVLLSAMLSVSILFFVHSALAGEDYLDPIGGWRYTYDGTGDAFGVAFGDALDGTWSHNQGDKWDGTAPGDTLSLPGDPVGVPSTPTGGPAGTSPGGAGSITDGADTFLRVQDVGNPETHGWCQNEGACFGTGDMTNTNRRVYFGHDMTQEGAIAQPLILSDPAQGVTISFRARIPTTGPLDPLVYLEGGNSADFNGNLVVGGGDFLNWQSGFGTANAFPDPKPDISEGNADANFLVDDADFSIWKSQLGNGTPNTLDWFDDDHQNGRGRALANMRGMINVVQSFPDTMGNDDIDSSVSFSLLTSSDVTDTCGLAAAGTICQSISSHGGSGGLVMNNLNGDFDPNTNLNPIIDNVTGGGGTLNLLDMSDSSLNDWTEFWITMENNGATAGNIEVKVYMNGSTSPSGTFQVTLGGDQESVYAKEDQPYLEFGISDNDGFGSLDLDFLSYSIGVLTPMAAPLSASFGAIPEPSSIALLVLGLAGVCNGRQRRSPHAF